MNVIQPGGKEEVAGLLRYARGLDPVSSVKEGLETLRRWCTARALAAALHLPPAAPSEALKSLYTLIRNLERKHDALRTHMSLAKPALQVQYPTEEGVTNIADMIEKELCQAAGKEAVVRIHSDNALELVTKKMAQQINARSIFKTVTMQYNPASNGRVERAVQSLQRQRCSWMDNLRDVFGPRA